MNCDLLRIHALCDQQLDSSEEKVVRDHLEVCTNCNAEYLAVSKLKQTLKTKTDVVDSKESWAKCQKRLKELNRASRIESFIGRYSWAMCGLLFMIIVSASMTNHFFGRNSVHSGEVAKMVSSLSPIPNIGPTNWLDAKRWLRQTVGSSPTAQQPEGLTVVGTSSGEIGGRRVARLNLCDKEGVISLFVIPEAQGVEGTEPLVGRSQYVAGQIERFHCIAWTDGELTLVLVADRDPMDLAKIADLIRVK